MKGGKETMTRENITVEMLRAKGYSAYEFGFCTLEDAVRLIKQGGKCELVPDACWHMVGVVNGKEMFARDMTAAEREMYAEQVANMQEHDKRVGDRIRGRNLAKIRRRG